MSEPRSVPSNQRVTDEQLAEYRELVPLGSLVGVGGKLLAQLLDEIEYLRPMAESWESYEAAQARKAEMGLTDETKSKWKCGADRSGIGGNMPQDCNWPYCGCDETATKVIEALQEQGWMPVPRSASMPNRVRPQESPNKSKVEYIEELASYCGFAPRYALHNLPRSRELEALLEHLANAQDDALRLHHAYVDLKYPQSAPSAQETVEDRIAKAVRDQWSAEKASESPLARAIRIARGDVGPPDEPVRFGENG